MHERANRINRRKITTNSTHLIFADVFNIPFRANIPDGSRIQQIFNAGNGESTRRPLREFITETRNAESFHDRTVPISISVPLRREGIFMILFYFLSTIQYDFIK